MDVDKNQYEVDEQEIEIKSVKLKSKIFEYFYIILDKKNNSSKITLSFLHILEIMQMISYAFFPPHLMVWKIPQKKIEIFSFIISVFRLTPLLNFLSNNIHMVIFIIIIILIFAFFLIIIMQILFRKDNSKIYRGLLTLTRGLIAPLTIFFYIPITELLLIIFRCNDHFIDINSHAIKCYTGMHLFYLVLCIFGVIIFFLTLTFLNYFYFSPFQHESSTIKINSTLDIFLLSVKFIYIIRLTFIVNEYLSIIILLFLSFFLLMKEYKSPTYNFHILEIIINIRNALISWTFLILLIAKLCENSQINGLIYLVFV